MILVITLLSILFVIGVAFLATMNFEADMIVAERSIARTQQSVQSANGATDRLLREALIGGSGSTLASAVVSATATSVVVDLPGFHSLSAPIEPYRNANGDFVYGWFSDIEWAMTGKHFIDDPSDTPGSIDRLCEGRSGTGTNSFLGTYTGCEILTTGGPTATGEWAISGDPDPDMNRYPYEVFPGDYVAPVDVDGDGIRDSFQVNIRHLGFSRGQQEALSEAVNKPGQVRDDVFLGLRVIPHGGMVNLNDAHPRLIETVLDLGFGQWPAEGNAPDPNLNFFIHRPTQTSVRNRNEAQVFYAPALDEAPLRRRGFLPPATTMASYLHGNRFANGAASDALAFLETSDVRALFPPRTDRNGIRFWPLRYDEESLRYDTDYVFDLRMDPFRPNRGVIPSEEYDRRHVVTTTSHDDLLSRGAKTVSFDNDGVMQVLDFRDAMMRANERAYRTRSLAGTVNACPDPTNPADPEQHLPFEYANYPQTLPNNDTCECPGDPACAFDFRKGRLQLSLSWLDDAFADGVITKPQREAIIYDAFAMMIANVVGPFWKTQPICEFVAGGRPVVSFGQPNAGQPCPDGSFCRFPGGSTPIPGTLGYCESTAPAWGSPPQCTIGSTAECGSGPYVCEQLIDPVTAAPLVLTSGLPDTACVDSQIKQARLPAGGNMNVQMPRPQALISRAAAELTANLLDYVDGATTDPNEDLSCVALRSYDFTTVLGTGATSAGQELLDAAGRPIYAYGVERQPYITEVTTFMPSAGPSVSAWAVELFNPYPDVIPAGPGGAERFWLFVGTDPNTAVRIPITTDFTVNDPLVLGSGFKVVFNGPEGDLTEGMTFPGTNPTAKLRAGSLNFANGDTVYLVRRVVCPDASSPTFVVVDQMKVQGAIAGTSKIGQGAAALTLIDPTWTTKGNALFSIQRIVTAGSEWTAPIPDEAEMPQLAQRLGAFNTRPTTNLHPVEVQPLNIDTSTGYPVPDQFARFSRLSLGPQAAFQTTGALLMLTRHGNHAITDFNTGSFEDLSFTRQLVGETTWYEAHQNTPGAAFTALHVSVREQDQIDNGRMPVFDLGVKLTPVPGGADVIRSAHHLSPVFTPFPTQNSPARTPGGAATLPWGQFLFDYFTVLPLSGPGPYRTPAGGDGAEPWAAAQPRVDMNGLRVHGRIDINAAPWTVMRGLPYVPMARLPLVYRDRFRNTLGLNSALDDDADVILNNPAQGIVGYREARLFSGFNSGTGSPEFSGDYGDAPSGRGWNIPSPSARRGTGFLTVGELANIRHPSHTPGLTGFRFDEGLVDFAQPRADYVRAVARLVALSDWVTVKSHVFTVYGAVRGAPGAVPEDDATANGSLSLDRDVRQRQLTAIDGRAIRFQETTDRLPMLLGEPGPTRIGGSTLSAYTDANTD